MAFTTGYKVNEGTDYEFTVSNETIQEAVLADGGITESDIAAYCYSALIDSRIETVKIESHTDTQQGDWASWCQDNAMFYYVNNTRAIKSNTGINNTSDKVYERNFLIWYGTIYPGEENEKSGWFLIMDIKDIKKFYVDFSNAGFSQSSVTSRRTDSVVTTPFTGYTGDAYLYQSNLAGQFPVIYQNDDTITTIRVVNVLNINDELWVGRLNPSNYGEQTTGETKYGYSMYIDYYDRGWLNSSDTEHFYQKGTLSWSGIPKIYDMEYPDLGFDVSPDIESYAVSDDMLIRVDAQHYGGFIVDSVAVVGTKTLDGILKWMSWCGLLFKYGGVTYKPIIESGVIVGFSSNMFAPSEFDTMTNVTGNNISPTPPSGGGDDDDESDDQASGGIYGGAQGMCNLYYMTAGEIKDLQNWFRGSTFPPGIQIPADFDPSNQLIGLMAFPIELGGSVDSTTITFRTADNQAVDTGVSCQKAYGDDLKFDMGTIDIPARMQQRGVPFLDYSCQVEVYIPFCDVVQLDVQQVIGTTLKCEMWISPATGDVSAMLSSGTHPVAYTSGNCAQQLPISVSSYGAIAGAKLAAQNRNTQAVLQAAQNVVKDITNTSAIGAAVSNHTAVNGQGLVEFSRIPQVQSNTGLAVGAGIKAAGTMVNTALQLTAQNFDNRYALQVAKNSAPTHVSGSFGSCTSWHFPNYCYVKITRPHFQKPDNYGHTEAVPVVATKSLGSLTGLTTCINPDVSGIGTATMQELETIKSYLMSGVIL